jgi:hypothetical protein
MKLEYLTRLDFFTAKISSVIKIILMYKELEFKMIHRYTFFMHLRNIYELVI